MSHTENILKMLPDRINQRTDLMVTPPWIAKDMVNLLPDEVWNKDSTFLDPACKSGIFLHEIYLKLMDTPAMIQEFPDNAERRKHILQNQLYGIALNPMCQLMSTRTVYGTIQGDNNIILIDNYINIIRNKDTKFFKETIKEQFGEMKFNVVIGNPPYQEDNSQNGRQAKSLYDKFISMGIQIANRLLVFITNNTFLTNESKIDIRNAMINNGLSKLYNYTKSGDIFNGIGVSACIFEIDKNNKEHAFEYHRIENNKELSTYKTILHHGDIIPDSIFDISISNKCKDIHNMGEIVLGAKAFGIASNGRIGFTGRGDFINYFIIPFDGCVTLKNKSITDIGEDVYVDRKDIPCGDSYIDMYKLTCPLVITINNFNTLNKASIMPSGYASTDGWTILGASTNENIIKNLLKYTKTAVFRINLRAFCSDGMSNITKVLMSHVPLPDLTEHSDIDWSQSIQDIDQQLYKKYNLTEEEIAYIEKTIKPMQ